MFIGLSYTFNLFPGIVNNPNKELTIKNVVEDLLQKNAAALADSRTPRSKPGDVNDTLTSILQPSDPTKSCSLPSEKTTNITEALFELPVNDSDKQLDQELVCALGSKIRLLPPTGQPLPMDITCYWCNFCSYRSEKKEDLLKHVMEHRFHCKFCTFQSFSRAKVIQHCKEQHDEFKETAATLIYCSYLPDYMSGVQERKRKATDQEVEEDPSKRQKASPRLANKKASAGARKTLPAPTNVGSASAVPSSPTPAPAQPIIMNVVSGQQAVSEVTGEPTPEPTPAPTPPRKEPEKKVTVSSGLCWNCGYCGFVTLSQAFLKIHLNAVHHGKAHKYVAMLVSSEDEMNRLKASDAQLVLNPSGDMPQPHLRAVTPPVGTPSRSTLPAPSKTILPPAQNPSGSQIEVDNAEQDSEKASGKTDAEKEAEAKIPVSFKCAHCNFSSPQVEKVKSHLLMRHSGSVIYALDMKAVKLRQQRYVFFCLKNNCKYNSKDMDDFIAHTDECSPWLQDRETKDVDKLLIKSLDLTRQFTTKIGKNKTSESVEVRAVSGAEYGCFYCQYVSNNNTRVKKHVISSHDDRNSIFKDFQADKNKTKPTVYFCRYCLWESREGSELEIHLSQKHPDKLAEKDQRASTSTAAAPTVQVPSLSSTPGPSEVRSPSVGSSTSRDSPLPDISPAASSSESESQDDTYVTYSGLVNKKDLDKAIKDYAEVQRAAEKRPAGRPTRNAALKAAVNARLVEGKMPPLYQCLYCKAYCFGTNLIRGHLTTKHKRQMMKAMDVEKDGRKLPSTIYLCGADNCNSTFSEEKELIKHGKMQHNQIIMPSGTSEDKKDGIKRLEEPDPNKDTGEKYECLYCDNSFISNNRITMKKHLKEKHFNEEYVYRDCIARKLRQNSRFYMCHDLTCEYTCEKQKSYSLHLLAHQKAKVYECLQCEWFTGNPDEVAKHVIDLHKGQKVVSMEVELDLDAQGNLVKVVGGKRIKAEKT